MVLIVNQSKSGNKRNHSKNGPTITNRSLHQPVSQGNREGMRACGFSFGAARNPASGVSGVGGPGPEILRHVG